MNSRLLRVVARACFITLRTTLCGSTSWSPITCEVSFTRKLLAISSTSTTAAASFQLSKSSLRSRGRMPSISGCRLSCTPSLITMIRSPALHLHVYVRRLRRSGPPSGMTGPSLPPQSPAWVWPTRLLEVMSRSLRVSASRINALQSPTEAHTKAQSLVSSWPWSSRAMPARMVVLPISSSGYVFSQILRCASLKERRRYSFASSTLRIL
mmetsp:Transcript_10243/g.41723  ORF Transcript_10243/g.41723 Transcript_10243/m.41723 type:complete len:210 (-) Transcript_10243:278-907(-)